MPSAKMEEDVNAEEDWHRVDDLIDGSRTDEIGPEVESGRFVSFLECTDVRCGEIVVVAGDYLTVTHTASDLETDEEEEYEVTHYSPSSMHPAPPIIFGPRTLNDACRAHLAVAHELYWVDLAACANRLRILVEALLDQLKIARRGRKGKSENARLDLSDRIGLLQATRPGQDEALTALRFVGNVASHQGETDLAFMLDCFDILENAMDELLERRSVSRAERIKIIIDAKGERRF
jgi:hypothetical protein